MCAMLKKRREAGKQWGIVIVSEGAKLIGGTDVVTQRRRSIHSACPTRGIGRQVAQLIEEKTGIETRDVVLATFSGVARRRPLIASWASAGPWRRAACSREEVRPDGRARGNEDY